MIKHKKGLNKLWVVLLNLHYGDFVVNFLLVMSSQLRKTKVRSWSILSCSVPVFYFFCFLV
jgi:hypothetical protein